MNFKKNISLIRCSLYFLGVLPEDNQYTKIHFYISFSLLFLGALLNVRYLFFLESELELIETITFALAYTVTIIAMCMMKKNKFEIIKIFNWMNNDSKYYEYLSEESQKVINRQSVKLKRLSIFTYTVVILIAVSLIVGPIILSLKNNVIITKVSNKAWYPFAVVASPTIELIYTIRSLAIVYALYTVNTIDLFIILIVLHVCGQMKVLCDTINTYKGWIRHPNNKNYKKTFNHCNCLKCIIDHHNSIIQFGLAVENCVNIIIIVKLFVHGCQICVLGFLLLAGKIDTNSKIVTITIYCAIIVWSSFIYGWLGEKLTQHSYAIGNAVYLNSWYEFRQPKIRQMLSIIICRTRRPIKITAGKYFVMSLENIGELFVKWMSYLSVLKAVKSRQKSVLIYLDDQ